MLQPFFASGIAVRSTVQIPFSPHSRRTTYVPICPELVSLNGTVRRFPSTIPSARPDTGRSLGFMCTYVCTTNSPPVCDATYGFTGDSIEIHGPPNIAPYGVLFVAAVTATSPTTSVAPSAARETNERVMRMIGSLRVVLDQMPRSHGPFSDPTLLAEQIDAEFAERC